LFTVDVGNSSLSVGRWLDGELSASRFTEPADAAQVIDGPSAIISVSAARLDQLLRALPSEARQEANVLTGIPMELSDPSLGASTGQDRFAAALAVCPGPAIVIDAGTALTVDLVDGLGVFLGGFIAPGPQAALEGLSRAGSALPTMEPGCSAISPGQDTRSAMQAGVWGMVLGGADRLVSAAREVLPQARLVATGGWAEAWVSQTTFSEVSLDEQLVHRGIALWARQASDRRQGGPGDVRWLSGDAPPP